MNSTSVTHINNKEDPIPILPSILLGYRHPEGEIHIMDSGAWVACPGTLFPTKSVYVSLNAMRLQLPAIGQAKTILARSASWGRPIS